MIVNVARKEHPSGVAGERERERKQGLSFRPSLFSKSTTVVSHIGAEPQALEMGVGVCFTLALHPG